MKQKNKSKFKTIGSLKLDVPLIEFTVVENTNPKNYELNKVVENKNIND